MRVSGRHRYFFLAGAKVAEAVEALARLSPTRPIHSLRQHSHAAAIRRARTCYDHLAGRLGVALLDALVADEVLTVEVVPAAGLDPVLGAGRSQRYLLTAAGRERLAGLGVVFDPSGRRPLTRYCLDWSEQRPHLGGALGAALLDCLVERGWVVRAERRVVQLTSAGKDALVSQFGVDPTLLG